MLAASPDDVARVARYAEQVLDLARAGANERFYQSLPLCVLDAVFSIGVRYQAVRNVVARYCAQAGARQLRDGSALPPRSEQESIARFCERLRSWGPADVVAARLDNRQRTSTHPTSSVLKAEAVQRFADHLRAHDVEYFQDMAELSAEREAALESAVRTIPGQGSGLSWNYFRMLSRTEDLVKADRMVLRFVAAAVGRQVGTEVASDLVRKATVALQARYPRLTPRVLDGAIWSYQRNAIATVPEVDSGVSTGGPSAGTLSDGEGQRVGQRTSQAQEQLSPKPIDECVGAHAAQRDRTLATPGVCSTERTSSVETWPQAARIIDAVGKQLQAQYGQRPISSSVIMREVERAGGPKKGSALPSDYCYNKINAAPLAFEWHVFVEERRGFYKHLGPASPYTGSVMWKPAHGLEREVGEWLNGVCTLRFDPRARTRGERTRVAPGFSPTTSSGKVEP